MTVSSHRFPVPLDPEPRVSRATRHYSIAALALSVLGLFLAATASAAPPTISDVSFSGVTTEAATLHAKVLSTKRVSYHFEYSPADCALPESVCLKSPPTDQKVDSTGAPVEVSTSLAGLSPATTYHFRLVARITSEPGELAASSDLTFRTFDLPTPFGPCANDALRSGPGALLPDCRAFEQVSPVDKNGASITGYRNQLQTSPAGDAFTFFILSGLQETSGAQDFQTYLARRGVTGWSTQGVLPPAAAGPVSSGAGWTPDLSLFFSNTGESFTPPQTFRLRQSSDGEFETVSSGAGEGTLAGASTDQSKVYFQSRSQLTSDPVGGEENLYLYDRATQQTSLVGQVPPSSADRCGGSGPACVPAAKGSFAGPYNWYHEGAAIDTMRGGPTAGDATGKYNVFATHAISEDGSAAYFTVGGGNLYLRRDAAGPAPETSWVSAPRRSGGPDPLGTRPAVFAGATPDGQQAFFMSPEELTDDANTGPETPAPSIARVGLDGTTGKDLGFLPAQAKGLAIDPAGEYIYWADPVGGQIGRAKLNGSGPVTELKEDFVAAEGKPQYLAVDAGHVYWTDAENEGVEEGAIGRAKLNGSGAATEVEPEFIVKQESPEVKGPTNPQGIAVDHEHIYWGNAGPTFETRAISRANLDGTGVEETFVQIGTKLLAEMAWGLAVNSTHLFFTTNGTGNHTFVVRIDLSNKSETFFESGDGSEPRGIALDTDHVYWARQASNTIGRTNLDLAEKNLEYVKDTAAPLGVAVDGEHIYWSANQEVPPHPGNDLYRYDAASDQLTDLTPDAGDENGAEVQGVLGYSEDGSYIYFAANGDLDGAGAAQPGDCHGRGSNNGNLAPYSGECSLYLAHGGETTFIARLDGSNIDQPDATDASNWFPYWVAGGKTSRVSADGKTLVFASKRQLTDYENTGKALYRYRVGERIACVSCNPTGAPGGLATLFSIRAAVVVEPEGSPAIEPRNISDDGSLIFFESSERLVASDSDETNDVYEWEAAGSGSCAAGAEGGGCLYLISPGSENVPAFFADASRDGSSAFIFTGSPLVPQDKDSLTDAYVARVDGGLASQHPPDLPSCEGEGCREPAPALPQNPDPATARFSGEGNTAPEGKTCPRGKVRRNGRCKKKGHHKPHKKHKKQSQGRNGKAGR